MTRIRLTAQGLPQLFEWHSRARDGRLFWVEVSTHFAQVGGLPRVLVSLRDIDERKRAAVERARLEEQLRQAQKLESIGRLAGGVAHDFNNLLTCIIGNVDLAQGESPLSGSLAQSLGEIRHAAARAAELTGQLLAFSRKQPISPHVLDLKHLLPSVERMLRRLLGETVELRTQVAPDVGTIHADPGQIEQILVNLAVNAKDAMPEGGRLTIVADNVAIDQAFRTTHAGAREGEFVRIRVSDTGSGISPDVQEHIFEPFFTTKPMGKGTGLGLAMVFGAIQQNQGFIVLHSEKGQGTTFALHIPRFRGKVDVAAKAPPSATAIPTGTERVLLVEDDATVRTLSERILTRLGYQVVTCATGQDAIAAAQQEGPSFDLLIADIILPDIDGRTVAARLAQVRPGLRVLYCSGYSEDVIGHHGVVDQGLAFLPKPFTAEELARKVRSVLDRAGTRSCLSNA
jgi:signal transduction histidine kinase/CheY-like chemotaxis protein